MGNIESAVSHPSFDLGLLGSILNAYEYDFGSGKKKKSKKKKEGKTKSDSGWQLSPRATYLIMIGVTTAVAAGVGYLCGEFLPPLTGQKEFVDNLTYNVTFGLIPEFKYASALGWGSLWALVSGLRTRSFLKKKSRESLEE